MGKGCMSSPLYGMTDEEKIAHYEKMALFWSKHKNQSSRYRNLAKKLRAEIENNVSVIDST
jgi:hypothetical protein